MLVPGLREYSYRCLYQAYVSTNRAASTMLSLVQLEMLLSGVREFIKPSSMRFKPHVLINPTTFALQNKSNMINAYCTQYLNTNKVTEEYIQYFIFLRTVKHFKGKS